MFVRDFQRRLFLQRNFRLSHSGAKVLCQVEPLRLFVAADNDDDEATHEAADAADYAAANGAADAADYAAANGADYAAANRADYAAANRADNEAHNEADDEGNRNQKSTFFRL